MKAQKEVFDGNTIRRARRAIAKNETITYKDSMCPGLAIRIQKGTAGWYLIDRKFKRRIDAFGTFDDKDIPYLRGIVSRARAIAKDGGDPGPILLQAVKSATVEEAEATAAVKTGGAWIWEDLRDDYIAFAGANKQPTTVTTYRSNLGAAKNSVLAADFEPLMGKPVALITPQDILEVQNNILERGKTPAGEYFGNVRQANHTVSIIRSCFKHGVKNFKKTGLTVNPASEIPPFTLSKKQERKIKAKTKGDVSPLSQLQIGKIIIFLETWHSAPMRLAEMIKLITGQRVESVISAKKREFVKAAEGSPYTMVWELNSDKVGSARSIPLPYFGVAAVEAALKLARDDNEYLFPQLRPRRAGDEMNGHMSKRGENKIWMAMRQPDGPLGDCAWKVAGHDTRRAFVTHMKSEWEVRQLPSEKSVELISHADEGAETVADELYRVDKRLREKWRVMRAWQDFVGVGYEYALEGISADEARRRYIDWRMEKEKELGLLDL